MVVQQAGNRDDFRSVVRRIKPDKASLEKAFSEVQKAILQHGIVRAKDWGPEHANASKPAATLTNLEEDARVLERFFGFEPLRILELPLQPGLQLISPPYDKDWWVGMGTHSAQVDGKMYVLVTDGFAASGLGFFVEVETNATMLITPRGEFRGSLGYMSSEPNPRILSQAGAGVVVYDGDALLVSRQPVVWDVRGLQPSAGIQRRLPFASVASPADPGNFGVSLAPVCLNASAKRSYLIWFYIWHIGAGLKDQPCYGLLSADLPMVTVTSGPPVSVR